MLREKWLNLSSIVCIPKKEVIDLRINLDFSIMHSEMVDLGTCLDQLSLEIRNVICKMVHFQRSSLIQLDSPYDAHFMKPPFNLIEMELDRGLENYCGCTFSPHPPIEDYWFHFPPNKSFHLCLQCKAIVRRGFGQMERSKSLTIKQGTATVTLKLRFCGS